MASMVVRVVMGRFVSWITLESTIFACTMTFETSVISLKSMYNTTVAVATSGEHHSNTVSNNELTLYFNRFLQLHNGNGHSRNETQHRNSVKKERVGIKGNPFRLAKDAAGKRGRKQNDSTPRR